MVLIILFGVIVGLGIFEWLSAPDMWEDSRDD
jgi:hypothetical protein